MTSKKLTKKTRPKPSSTTPPGPRESAARAGATPGQRRAAAQLDAICNEFNGERSVLAQAERLAEANALHKLAYPETAQGAAPGKAGGGKVAKTDRMSAFADWIAKRISCSARQVRRLVVVGAKLDLKARKLIHGTPLANRTCDLVDLAQLDNPKVQLGAVQTYRSEGPKAFRKVLAEFVEREKPTPSAPWSIETESLATNTPIKLRLPIGVVMLELVQDGLALRVRVSKVGAAGCVEEADPPASVDEDALPESLAERSTAPNHLRGPDWSVLSSAATEPLRPADVRALTVEDAEALSPDAVRLQLSDDRDAYSVVFEGLADFATKVAGKRGGKAKRLAEDAGLAELGTVEPSPGATFLIGYGTRATGIWSVAIGRFDEVGELPDAVYAAAHGDDGRFACRVSLQEPALGEALHTWVVPG